MSTTSCSLAAAQTQKVCLYGLYRSPCSSVTDRRLASSSVLKKVNYHGVEEEEGRAMTILKGLRSCSSWPVLVKADTVCDTESGLSTSTGIKPRHQYCFKTQSIFGHSAHTSQVLL